MIKRIELLEPYMWYGSSLPGGVVYEVGKQYNGHELWQLQVGPRMGPIRPATHFHQAKSRSRSAARTGGSILERPILLQEAWWL